jgi:phage shock protein A
MGVFTRFKDIVSSNMNAILDRAEDPRKMIRLMIQEMEETLVEMKSSCAGTMAARQKALRELEEIDRGVERWSERAARAVDKERDDLAREALAEKAALQERRVAVESEAEALEEVIRAAREDIARLEDKLAQAKEKQRVLAARHERASESLRAGMQIRKADGVKTMVRFDKFESRIERLEAEADLEREPGKPTLDQEFEQLERGDAVEEELAALKAERGKNKQAAARASEKKKG